MSCQEDTSAIEIQTPSQRFNNWFQEKSYGKFTFLNKRKRNNTNTSNGNDSIILDQKTIDDSTTDTISKMNFSPTFNIYNGLSFSEITSLRNAFKNKNKERSIDDKKNKLSKRIKFKEHLKNTVYKIRKKRLDEKNKCKNLETNSEKSRDSSILGESSCYSKFKSQPHQLSLLFEDVINNDSVKDSSNNILNFNDGTNSQKNFFPDFNYLSFQRMGNSIYETFNSDKLNESNIKLEPITRKVLKRDLSEDMSNEYPSKRQCLSENDISLNDSINEKKENQICNSTEFMDNENKINSESKDKSISLEELSLRTYSTRESSISTTSSKIYSIPTFKNERNKLTIADIVESLYQDVVSNRNVGSILISKDLTYNYQDKEFFQQLPDNFFDKSELLTNQLFNPINISKTKFNQEKSERKNPSIRFNEKCSLLIYKKKERPKTVNSSIILPEYKSILKKKENKRKDIELMKVEQCDKVDVKCFFKKFYESENRKMEEDGKYQKVRERQLDRYYEEEHSLNMIEKKALKDVDSNQHQNQMPKLEKSVRTLKGVCIIQN